MREKAGFHIFFEKSGASARKIELDDPKLPRKRNVSSHYEEGESLVEFGSTAAEHYRQIFYQAIDMVAHCIRDRFQQKVLIETIQIMKIMLLKALYKEDFGYKLQQTSLFLAVTLINLNG